MWCKREAPNAIRANRDVELATIVGRISDVESGRKSEVRMVFELGLSLEKDLLSISFYTKENYVYEMGLKCTMAEVILFGPDMG